MSESRAAASDSQPTKATDASDLPGYVQELDAFHSAFGQELKAVVAGLPLQPQARVLDVGCGDGTYTRWLGERLDAGGAAVGVDVSEAYLALARRRTAAGLTNVEFVQGGIEALPFPDDYFEFAWCAQSLYSLPDPVVALSKLRRVVKPGGTLAVLENDSLHYLLLPWPPELELALAVAELKALADESRMPRKFYVGRRLRSVLASAGWEACQQRSFVLDRQAPLQPAEQHFLEFHFRKLAERAGPHLGAAQKKQLAEFIDPAGSLYLLDLPYFTMTVLNVVAWGRKG